MEGYMGKPIYLYVRVYWREPERVSGPLVVVRSCLILLWESKFLVQRRLSSPVSIFNTVDIQT